MNLRKLKNQAGFTLVELIVVIAIMAILAGVAVPVYSGYIEKANKAADLQLLGAVNSAFGAACVENGVDVYTVEGTPTISNFKEGDSGAITVSVYPESFTRYFAGNEDAKFKSITALYFNKTEGVFAEDEVQAYTYIDSNGNKITINVPQSVVNSIKNSTFGQKIGAEGLLGKVDTVSGIGSLLLSDGGVGNVMDNLIFADDEGEAYYANLRETLKLSEEEFNAIIESEGGYDFLANSVVLTAAQQTAGLDTSFLGTEGSATTLRAQLDSEDPAVATEAMSKLAMTYAMYTAYANHTGDAEMLGNLSKLEQQNDFTGMTNILSGLESDEFRTYLGTDAGKADLAAYQSAMKVINDTTTTNPSVTVEILQNGFTDEDLKNLLGDVMK